MANITMTTNTPTTAHYMSPSCPCVTKQAQRRAPYPAHANTSPYMPHRNDVAYAMGLTLGWGAASNVVK